MTSTTARRWRLSAATMILALAATLLGAGTAAGPAAVDPPAVPAPASADDTVRLRVSPINLTAPRQVTVGSRIRFSGSLVVKKRKPRAVVVSERLGGRWRPVARKRSTRGGTFKVTVAAGRSAKTRTFRASAPAARGLRALRTGPLRIKVVGKKQPDPQGPLDEADDWSYLVDGGIRWNPCATIRWAYNPAGQRYGALADVTTAFAKISAQSGLTFEYAGTTSYRYVDGESDFPDDVDIAVAWANASELNALSGDVVGIGGGSYLPVSGQDVDWRMVHGYLTLDKGGSVTPAPGYDGQGWGQIMMHEILHALGLGHARLSNQLMYPVATPKNYRFGRGDLTGMTKVGAAAGCLP